MTETMSKMDEANYMLRNRRMPELSPWEVEQLESCSNVHAFLVGLITKRQGDDWDDTPEGNHQHAWAAGTDSLNDEGIWLNLNPMSLGPTMKEWDEKIPGQKEDSND